MKHLLLVSYFCLLLAFNSAAQDLIGKTKAEVFKEFQDKPEVVSLKEYTTGKHRIYVQVKDVNEMNFPDTIRLLYYIKDGSVNAYTKLYPNTIYWQEKILTWLYAEVTIPFGSVYMYFHTQDYGIAKVYEGYYLGDNKMVRVTEDPFSNLLVLSFTKRSIKMD